MARSTVQRLVIAGVVATCALGGALVWTHSSHDPQPTPAAAGGATTSSQGRDANSVRPLVYAVGQTVHVGSRSVDTHLDVLSLVAAEGGAAFSTFDGALWFTDGSTVTQIGRTTPAQVTATGVAWGPAGQPNDRVVADDAGPDIAWMEYPGVESRVAQPTIAVFDTHVADAVVRVPFRASVACPACARIVSLRRGIAYVADGPLDLHTGPQSAGSSGLFRVDLRTGRRKPVSVAAYLDLLESSPRQLVIGTSPDNGLVGDGVGVDFEFVDQQLVAHAVSPQAVFEARSRRPLQLRGSPSMARGMGLGDPVELFEWLDDDRFALLDISVNAGLGVDQGDIVTCRISTSTCAVAVRATTHGSTPIVPGVLTAGSEQAEALAIRGQSIGGSIGRGSSAG